MKKLVLAAMLFGMGTFVMAQQTEKRMQMKDPAEMQKMKDQRQKDHLDQMKKELNLSDAQVQKIKSVQDQHFAERRAEMQKNQEVRKQKMAEMKERRAEHDAEMKQILTPEQYQTWQKNKEQKMKERKDKFKEKRMDGLQDRKAEVRKPAQQ